MLGKENEARKTISAWRINPWQRVRGSLLLEEKEPMDTSEKIVLFF